MAGWLASRHNSLSPLVAPGPNSGIMKLQTKRCANYVLATLIAFRGSQPVRNAPVYICNHLLPFKTDAVFQHPHFTQRAVSLEQHLLKKYDRELVLWVPHNGPLIPGE